MSDLKIGLLVLSIYVVGAVITAIIIRILYRLNIWHHSEHEEIDDTGAIAVWPIALLMGVVFGVLWGFPTLCRWIAKKIVPDKEAKKLPRYRPEDLAEVDKFLEEDVNTQIR